jgi:hypothetical protein
MRDAGRPLVYGGLTIGALALSALAELSKEHIWFGGSLLVVPVFFDCFLQWCRLRNRERRDARVIQMIEQQHAAMLNITTALSADRSLAASIVSLRTLNYATHALSGLLVAPGLAETRIEVPNDVGPH